MHYMGFPRLMQPGVRALFRFSGKSDIVTLFGREKGRNRDIVDEEGERDILPP